VKKIVIIGPESTGKSTLCEQLAEYYKTSWCPEYAREYLLTYGTDYTYSDLLTIAQGQVALEEKLGKTAKETGEAAGGKKAVAQATGSGGPAVRLSDQPFFIDTDMYVMKVWCEFVFGNCHRYILDQIVQRDYDLYLLCNVDLPWVKDELREYPDLDNRLTLYYFYKDIMVNQSVPWVSISGGYEERLRTAIKSVDRLLKR